MHRQICRLLPRSHLFFFLSPSESYFATTLSRCLACLLPRCNIPPLNVVTRSHPPRDPRRRRRRRRRRRHRRRSSLALSRTPRFVRTRRGETRGYYRVTGWWKSGWSQIEPRPDRGQRTPTRRGSRGCLSVRHRRGWRGSGPRGWLCRLCATRTGKGRKEARPRGTTASSATTMASPRISFIGEMSLCVRDARRDRITPRRPTTA